MSTGLAKNWTVFETRYKPGKKYLISLTLKSGNLETFDTSNVFLPLTAAKLSTVKNSPVIGSPCMYVDPLMKSEGMIQKYAPSKKSGHRCMQKSSAEGSYLTQWSPHFLYLW